MTVQIIRPADRAAWLAARRQDVTASVAGCLLGVHPYTTAYGLWASKTGRIPDEDIDSPALRRGRLLEPVAIAMLREDYPDWKITYLADSAYYRDVDTRMGATPDAFATRPDIFGQGVVQVKTASDYAFRDWQDPDTREIVLPLWIAVQVLVEAELTGAAWACVALIVVGRGIELHVIDVPLHAGVKRRIRAAVREFWRMVDAGEHPPVDWKRDGETILDVYRDSMPERRDLTADEQLDALVADYRASKEAAAAAAKRADEIKPQIIAALGNAELGETVNWEVSARTTHKGSYTVKPSQSRVLRVKPRKDIHYASF